MAKSIMIQGTMSNAGKSLLVAGLCRVFYQDGYRVAPFKSQNMALNSYITQDGYEMGRAQVMQAEAAGIEPDIDMNPILLKPTSNIGSQVIINGRVEGNMKAMQYYKEKTKYIPDIMNAYERLSAKNDIIVLEGAGSPAEINLKDNDIVNMGMAKMAHSPVLLAGDIDRGGVFAQLYGTIALLEDTERDYIKGLIINKFRGDKDILMPGIDMLQERCKKKVLGVIPYINVDIDDEDSLSERFKKKKHTGLIDIAVIRLPRISNFTDFNIFECFEEVNVNYVTSPGELNNPDMIIIPGTKNTIEDLMWMRQSGIEARILKAASENTIIFGICGGYQMLGETISDPQGMEHKGSIKGLGLLPVNTVFENEKTRTRAAGVFNNIKGILSPLSNMNIEGYEIHMGHTVPAAGYEPMCYIYDENTMPAISKQYINNKTKTDINAQPQTGGAYKYNISNSPDGAYKDNVYGSYVHGIFDATDVARTIIMTLLKEKGYDCKNVKVFDIEEYKQKQYDILADAIRQSMDMERVYDILDKGMNG